jgi:hypothetical protein
MRPIHDCPVAACTHALATILTTPNCRL